MAIMAVSRADHCLDTRIQEHSDFQRDAIVK